MSNRQYKTIKDLPEELRMPLYGAPYKQIHDKNLPFSLGYSHWDFMVSLVVFCFLSKVFLGDYYGREHFFIPWLAGALVYIISEIRHRVFNKKKAEEWKLYCQGYIDRLNHEGKVG